MGNDAPIIQKIYDFYREIYLAVEKMPKKDKYTLGEKIQLATLEILELIISASYIGKETKLSILHQASVKLDLVKILLRLAYDIKSIDSKKYVHLQELLQEIGRMLGGWIRSTKAS